MDNIKFDNIKNLMSTLMRYKSRRMARLFWIWAHFTDLKTKCSPEKTIHKSLTKQLPSSKLLARANIKKL